MLASGTISTPIAINATGGARFTVNTATANFTRITGFSAGNTIAISSNSGALVVANSGADVVLTVNINGTVTQITLVGVTTPAAIIGSLAAFNALNHGQVTYTLPLAQ